MARRSKALTPTDPSFDINSIATCSMQLSEGCFKSNGLHIKDDFYMITNNLMWKGDRVHICKECMRDYIYIDGKIDLMKFKHLLKITDIPFLESEYMSAIAATRETLGMYMKNISLNHKGEGYAEGDNTELSELIEESFDLTSEVRKFWGYGYKPEEYEDLNNTFMDLINDFECDNSVTEMIFKNICKMQLLLDNELKVGNIGAIDKLSSSISKALTDGDIKPSKNGADGRSGQIHIAELIRRFEVDKPIPDPLAEWRNNDLIKQYIKVFFTGHLLKTLGKPNADAKEYEDELAKYTVEVEDVEDTVSFVDYEGDYEED